MIEKILEYVIAPILIIGCFAYLNKKYHSLARNPAEKAKYLEGVQKEQDIMTGKGTPFRYIMIPIWIIAFLCVGIILIFLLVR
jgi:hypothetical protein